MLRPTVIRHRGNSRGFSLIELMVAVTLTLLVMGAVAVVYAGTSRNRGDIERSGRLADNAHYSLEVLSEEIQHAGYFAELVTLGAAWQVPDPCATAIGAQGWSAAPFQVPAPIVGYAAADATPGCLPNRQPETAIVVVRRVSPIATAPAVANAGGYLQVSKCVGDPKLFVVSNTPADFTLHNLDCTTVADVRALLVRAYYVASCDVCGVDAIPTLKRAELVNGEIVIMPVAEGVENLQVEYGFDADGDGKPDRYLAAPDATLGAAYGQWANVMAARMYALFRSTDVQPGYVDATKRFNLGPAGVTEPANDGYRRVLLTSVVIPKNPAGQRESP